MKPEEIIKYLEMVRPMENYSHTFSVSVGNTRHFGPGSQLNKDVSTAIDLAIQALEKQIAKKVIRIQDDVAKCPHCESYKIYYFEEDLEFNYCPECGQRIDWGNEE